MLGANVTLQRRMFSKDLIARSVIRTTVFIYSFMGRLMSPQSRSGKKILPTSSHFTVVLSNIEMRAPGMMS